MEADALIDELSGQQGAGKPSIAKVRYTHDAMIDLIVKNPWISQNEIAQTFGYTVPWVSIVFSSDAFKERLEARKAELVDPVIRATIQERFQAVVVRSLEVLQEKLSKPAGMVSDNLALRAAELGAKGLGIGGHAVQSGGHTLEALAMRLVELKRTSTGGQTYEGQVVVEVPNTDGANWEGERSQPCLNQPAPRAI